MTCGAPYALRELSCLPGDRPHDGADVTLRSKDWIEPKPGGVKAKVKADMQVGEAVEGDFFFARLDASSETEISVSAVLKLYEQQAISRSELVDMLSVRNEPARKILPPKTIQRISRTFVGTARLVVSRKDGVEMKLADAVSKIADELLGPQMRPAA